MAAAHERGTPVMRPLFYDFADDPTAWAVDDAYMFGPDLLIAPVLEPSCDRRRVYLPAGAPWIDVWTGEAIDGGSWLDVDSPIGRIPLFSRTHSMAGLINPDSREGEAG
jgi:alpha-D-xyloside xylohydrolase